MAEDFDMNGPIALRESEVRSYCRSFPAVFERAKGSCLFDQAVELYPSSLLQSLPPFLASEVFLSELRSEGTDEEIVIYNAGLKFLHNLLPE